DRAVLTPRAPAPVHLRRQQLFGAVALGVQLLPRDIGLRIPLERLGPPPQLPHVGHRRGQRQRIALLEHVRSGALLLDEHGSPCPLYEHCLTFMRASAGGAPAPRRSAARTALQRAELGVLDAGQIELPGGEPLAHLRDRGAQDAPLLRRRRGAETEAGRLYLGHPPRLPALPWPGPRVPL